MYFVSILSVFLFTYRADNGTKWLFSDPNKPTVQCQSFETSITVQVNGPDSGGVDKYVASCLECNKDPETEEKPAGGVVEFSYDQLQNAVEYRIEVHSVFGTKKSEIREANCTTGEGGKLRSEIILFGIHYIADADSFSSSFSKSYFHYVAAPGPVKSFRFTNVETNSVTLLWEQPEQTNGRIQEYLFTYAGTKRVCLVGTLKLQPKNEIQIGRFLFNDLKKYT